MGSLGFTCCIPGNPVPKGRPRFWKGHAVTPQRTRDAEKMVRMLCVAAGIRPLSGPVRVELAFYRSDKRRVDLDNMSKLIWDSLNEVAWEDDSQIVELVARKGYDKTHPRTVIEIRSAA